ncbi:MAG: A24 family peptidase [Acidobacteriaceae bacterium]|nr:A24 family peptidase [Acidobacteriaceae bacterium]
MMHPSHIQIACVTTVVLLGACTDLLCRRIPNWLTLPALAGALVMNGLLFGAASLGTSLLSALIAGGFFLLFFLAGGMGGGDVKLVAAAAAGVGLARLPSMLVFTALVGGVMGIALALRHKQLQRTLLNVGTLAVHHRNFGLEPHPELHVQSTTSLRLPYGIAIAAGTVLSFFAQGSRG